VEFDESQEDEGPLFAWLPPEDRLWRHPSEMGGADRGGPTPSGSTATIARPRVWSLALVAGLAGAMLASGLFMATGTFERRTTVLDPVVTPNTVALAVQSPAPAADDWASIDDQVAASIVSIQVTSDRGVETGSGILYGSDRRSSYVLTAGDLVTPGGPVAIAMSFDDGSTQSATLVGSDPVTGIAVLAATGTHHTFPAFGSVSDVEVAEPVLAIGARAATGSPVSTGVVSGVDEAVTTAEGDSMSDMLAVSGLSIPDSSDGGALVDEGGEVIGIDTVVTSADPAGAGVSYAVPIDMAQHVARQLLAGRTPTHPWVGVADATDLSSVTARQLGVAGGCEVGTVEADSPAAVAGIRPNDIITAIGDRPVASSGALVTWLAEAVPDRSTSVSYVRDGVKATVRMTVAEQPAG
jgi:putative serine protease PepD